MGYITVANCTIESNQKSVNNLYLKKKIYESDTTHGVGVLYKFDSTETSTLWSIANQNPLTGGDAVFQARKLLWVDVYDLNNSGARHAVPKPSSKKLSGYKLYPNPNSGKMTMEYEMEGTYLAILSIYSIDGRLVKLLTLNTNEKSITIDASELKEGVYYYTVKEDGKIVKTEKLVIVR